ncbi:hypothetical protein A6F68_00707 [Tsuneonella dongtanensis]|uniref:DUF924 domain-containing protein n=1 Tax=Tsuneonella dongtanensis TaxID=692370 RepID=A0A1B2AAR6_9SPHN|nr:DUF924 family protein [Tsuneonella dongtanensis]ANY19236.1 hypothetical protein A6F68_00707 [Tsuneonella dongtanensis]
MAPRRWAADLLHFWFHALGPGDWWGGSPELDARIARRFGRELNALRVRPAREFLRDRQTALAAILLFDQVPRNVHRGTARAFATDPLGRAITRRFIAMGWHRSLDRHARAFAGMPLMHSEAIADQRASLAYFRKVPGNFAFARSHWRMIARFGRYPHRNPVLGRRSTPAERAAVAAGNAW